MCKLVPDLVDFAASGCRCLVLTLLVTLTSDHMQRVTEEAFLRGVQLTLQVCCAVLFSTPMPSDTSLCTICRLTSNCSACRWTAASPHSCTWCACSCAAQTSANGQGLVRDTPCDNRIRQRVFPLHKDPLPFSHRPERAYSGHTCTHTRWLSAVSRARSIPPWRPRHVISVSS